MTDKVDPRLAQQRERTKAARERLEKAEQREKAIAAEIAVAARKAEITLGVQGAVKQALSDLKLDIPPEGLTLFVHPEGENGTLAVDVKIGRGKSNGNGNGNRKTITVLGYTGFVLPDGSEVKSPAAVLAHFKHNGGDAAHREILKWVKDNPDNAATVKVIIGKDKIALTEAVKRI